MVRRRWAGWKLSEVQQHLDSQEGERKKHCAWRDSDIEFIRKNGFNVVATQHLLDGGVDRTKRSVKVEHKMQETFHLGSDVLWPRDTFINEFKMPPEEAGYKEIGYHMPNGDTIKGVRLPHKAGDDLPEGGVLIRKDFKIDADASAQTTRGRLSCTGLCFSREFELSCRLRFG